MNDEINEALIQKELQKPLGGALLPLEWYILFSFVDHAMKQDNMFTSQEDAETLAATVKRLHDQIFPAPKEPQEVLAETLALPKKKLILPQGSDIIV